MPTNQLPLDSEHNVKTNMTPEEFAEILNLRCTAEGVYDIEDPKKKALAIADVTARTLIQGIKDPAEVVKFYKSQLDRKLHEKVQEAKRALSVQEFNRWQRAVESGQISLDAGA